MDSVGHATSKAVYYSIASFINDRLEVGLAVGDNALSSERTIVDLDSAQRARWVD